METQATVDASTTYHPHDLASARDAVVDAAASGHAMLVRGGATKLDWGRRPAGDRTWAVIDTRGMGELIHHEPGDMTATVQAGMPLDLFQERLAAEGQELAIDPPERGGVPTVGGVFAAADAGPRRFGFGAGGIRDLVIGSTVVLSDGTVSRSGGTVIKNVAGYDLTKLWCGSLGTLALVVDLTVRLHPRPEASRALVVPASSAEATQLVLDVLASPVECSVLEWAAPAPMIMKDASRHGSAILHDHGRGAVLLGLEGRAAGLDARTEQLVELVRRHGLAAEHVEDANQVLVAWREAHAGWSLAGPGATGGGPPVTVARASTLPSQLDAVADALTRATTSDVEVGLVSHAGLGLHDAVVRGSDPAAHAAVLTAWRTRVRHLGGSVTMRDRPDAAGDELIDPWDPPSVHAGELMRSVKRALDPEGRFAPGRFVGGL